VWTLVRLSLGNIHLLWRGVLQGQQCAYLLQCGPPLAVGEQPASPQAAKESLLWHLEHLIPLTELTLEVPKENATREK